jgi:hypothetical protein
VTDVLPDIELTILVDDLEIPQCESVLHQEWKLPPHEAHWYASAPCMSLMAVCEDRKRKCRMDGAWRCTPQQHGGCTAIHDYDQLDWTKVHLR